MSAAEEIREAEDDLRAEVATAAQRFAVATGLALTGIEVEFLDAGTAGSPGSTILGEVHVRWRVGR